MEIYSVQDVCRILGVGTSKAQKIIRQLNEELEKKGYLTIRGKIPRRYFEERFYCK